MGSWNRLSTRFGKVGNESSSFLNLIFLCTSNLLFLGVNDLIYDLNFFGDRAVEALELARFMQREFDRRQQRLGEVMTQLGYGYGGPSGVAHAAEIAPEQREQFAEYWSAGVLSLPPRPARPTRPQPSPPPRRTWRRHPSSYYAELEDRNDPGSGSEALGNYSGQGSPQRGSRGDENSGSEDNDGEEEDDRAPPSPPPPSSGRK
jgi:hypothetical protein